jgi:hypothetical protein
MSKLYFICLGFNNFFFLSMQPQTTIFGSVTTWDDAQDVVNGLARWHLFPEDQVNHRKAASCLAFLPCAELLRFFEGRFRTTKASEGMASRLRALSVEATEVKVWEVLVEACRKLLPEWATTQLHPEGTILEDRLEELFETLQGLPDADKKLLSSLAQLEVEIYAAAGERPPQAYAAAGERPPQAEAPHPEVEANQRFRWASVALEQRTPALAVLSFITAVWRETKLPVAVRTKRVEEARKVVSNQVSVQIVDSLARELAAKEQLLLVATRVVESLEPEANEARIQARVLQILPPSIQKMLGERVPGPITSEATNWDSVRESWGKAIEPTERRVAVAGQSPAKLWAQKKQVIPAKRPTPGLPHRS